MYLDRPNRFIIKYYIKKCFSSKTLNKIFYVQRKISPQKNGLLSDRS